MKRAPVLFLAVILLLIFGASAGQRSGTPYASGFAPGAATVLGWNTFLGSAVNYDGNGSAIIDFGSAIGADQNGNLYVVGLSGGSWGAPISPFGGGTFSPDIFVAKLDDDGALLWNTFLGISTTMTADPVGNYLHAANLTVDRGGNVYVVCTSADNDVCAAKIDGAGARQWRIALGSSSIDVGQAIAVDDGGNVYVGGASNVTWGDPVHAHYSNSDMFIAKLSAGGALQWNTFWGGSPMPGAIGSVGADYCLGLAVDGNGNVIAVGKSDSTWGEPIRPYSPSGYDTFVAKFDGSGARLWNTFLSASCEDIGTAVAVDAEGNAYVAGLSAGTWGVPVTPFAGQTDAFVAKFGPAGNFLWNTFLGSPFTEFATSLALDANGNPHVAGIGNWLWGSPDRLWSGDWDAFAAKLDPAGNRAWSTFLGGTGRDYGEGICLDRIGNVYVSGRSHASWGAPVRPFPGNQPKAFAAKLDVTKNQAILSTSKSDMVFGAVAGGAKSPDQTLRIFNAGTGTLDWSLSSNRSWLSFSPSTGSGAGRITVSVDPSGLPAGTSDTGAIRIASAQAYNSPLTVNVHLTVSAAGATAAPFGSFDTPVDGSQKITGAISVTGWALDDIGVQSVRIWRDAVSGETPGPWFIGDAVFVEGARPDVENGLSGLSR